MKRLFCVAALVAATMGQIAVAQADGVEFSVGQTSDSTMTYRLGVQFDWDKSWLQSDVGRLTGYWDAAYTFWEGDKTSNNHSLSFSPVFVYEFAGDNIKPYIEAGIGVSAFANTQLEDNKLGSSFNFEDRIGFGLRFKGGHEVGIRATHYSNAGIKQPNDGAESFALHYKLPF